MQHPAIQDGIQVPLPLPGEDPVQAYIFHSVMGILCNLQLKVQPSTQHHTAVCTSKDFVKTYDKLEGRSEGEAT